MRAAAGPKAVAGGAGGAESDSSDDEASRAAKLAATSAEARRKGNAAFAAGEFAKAVKQFTMAIRMDKTNHVLFSNRSAAHAGLGKYEDALADAERCVRMSPKWGKGYGRKGAALTGLGQGGEAVKAYLAGLAVEPERGAAGGPGGGEGGDQAGAGQVQGDVGEGRAAFRVGGGRAMRLLSSFGATARSVMIRT